MESHDSPEIPDRGETLDIPGLPPGGGGGDRGRKSSVAMTGTGLNTLLLLHTIIVMSESMTS